MHLYDRKQNEIGF